MQIISSNQPISWLIKNGQSITKKPQNKTNEPCYYYKQFQQQCTRPQWHNHRTLCRKQTWTLKKKRNRKGRHTFHTIFWGTSTRPEVQLPWDIQFDHVFTHPHPFFTYQVNVHTSTTDTSGPPDLKQERNDSFLIRCEWEVLYRWGNAVGYWNSLSVLHCLWCLHQGYTC